jgi:hypothetical protein
MGFPNQENPRRQYLSQDITTNLFGNSDLLFLKNRILSAFIQLQKILVLPL